MTPGPSALRTHPEHSQLNAMLQAENDEPEMEGTVIFILNSIPTPMKPQSTLF